MSSILSTGGGKALIDPADAVILLLDHQTGLFQTVKDIDVAQLRANTIALAKSNRVQTLRLQHNSEPVALLLAVQWDDRRPLPFHAQDFPSLFSAHVRSILG
jgi:hypothetical protein